MILFIKHGYFYFEGVTVQNLIIKKLIQIIGRADVIPLTVNEPDFRRKRTESLCLRGKERIVDRIREQNGKASVASAVIGVGVFNILCAVGDSGGQDAVVVLQELVCVVVEFTVFFMSVSVLSGSVKRNITKTASTAPRTISSVLRDFFMFFLRRVLLLCI